MPYTPKKYTFSPELFKQARRNSHLYQEQLAHLAGVHKQSIFQFEKGIVRPSSEVLLSICDVLKVNPYQLFILTDSLPE